VKEEDEKVRGRSKEEEKGGIEFQSSVLS